MRIFLAGLLTLLPGLCWCIWFEKNHRDPFVVLAKIFAISISIEALFALLFFILNIKLNQVVLLVIMASCLALSVVGILIKRNLKCSWTWLLALLGFGGLITWRLFQARDLVFPSWVDSLHHVLIVRKMIEFGGLPPDLSPYLSVPFYYHYAFHSSAALFSVFSGLEPVQAVLVWGQVLNAAVILSVYALAKSLFKDWKIALLAGLLVAFITKMPAYYLNWGRYTLLTGLVVLPLGIGYAVQLLREKHQFAHYLTLTILTAGVLLSHYFTALLFALFLIIAVIFFVVTGLLRREFSWQKVIFLSISIFAGFALALPWLLRVFRYHNLNLGLDINLPEDPTLIVNHLGQWKYVGRILGDIPGYILLVLGLIGVIILLVSKKEPKAFGAWSLILCLMAMPLGLVLRGFRFDHFAILLFLPIAILAAKALVWASSLLAKSVGIHWVEFVILAGMVISLLVYGVHQGRDIINPDTVLATEADRQALLWIEENIPEDARFFINTTDWGYGISRGVDGGAWILPLTGRWTLAPTIFYYNSQDCDDVLELKNWGTLAVSMGTCDVTFWQLLQEADITHIYIREGAGSLQARELVACAGIDRVYASGGVSLWEVSP